MPAGCRPTVVVARNARSCRILSRAAGVRIPIAMVIGSVSVTTETSSMIDDVMIVERVCRVRHLVAVAVVMMMMVTSVPYRGSMIVIEIIGTAAGGPPSVDSGVQSHTPLRGRVGETAHHLPVHGGTRRGTWISLG